MGAGHEVVGDEGRAAEEHDLVVGGQGQCLDALDRADDAGGDQEGGQVAAQGAAGVAARVVADAEREVQQAARARAAGHGGPVDDGHGRAGQAARW